MNEYIVLIISLFAGSGTILGVARVVTGKKFLTKKEYFEDQEKRDKKRTDTYRVATEELTKETEKLTKENNGIRRELEGIKMSQVRQEEKFIALKDSIQKFEGKVDSFMAFVQQKSGIFIDTSDS